MSWWQEPPPSYEATISKQWLPLVGDFLCTSSLTSAVLVCRKWNLFLSPFLWGDPLRHASNGLGNAAESLTSFQRCLKRVKIDTRKLVHTFAFREAIDEQDYSISHGWLQQALCNLPNLQSLVLASAPFLDAKALSLARSAECHQAHQSLRLLQISNGSNVTVAVLASFIRGLGNLCYLDLSGTRAARDLEVLHALGLLSELRVLKLANIVLDDNRAAVMMRNLHKEVRYLDLSNNRLSDQITQQLLSLCPRNPSYSVRPPPSYSIARQARSNDQARLLSDASIFKQLTMNFVDSLESDELNGLYSLNMSNNQLSSMAISKLLRGTSLRVLDAGSCSGSSEFLKPKTDRDGLLSQLIYLRVPFKLMDTGNRAHRSRSEDEAPLSGLPDESSDLEEVDQMLRNHIQTIAVDSLAPALHPELKTLVLTDVPCNSLGKDIAQGLIDYIKECAKEATLGNMNSPLDCEVLPGSPVTATDARLRLRKQFALQELQLEMQLIGSNPSEAVPHDGTRSTATKSVTGDADSENLWSAATEDFSFFDDTVEAQDMAFNSLSSTEQRANGQTNIQFDTVAEISAFRKKMKEQNETKLEHGNSMSKAGAFWAGNIKIIRSWK